MISQTVEEILVLFDRAVSDDRSFKALREHLEGAKPVAQYLRFLAADLCKADIEATERLRVSQPELLTLQSQILSILRSSLARVT